MRNAIPAAVVIMALALTACRSQSEGTASLKPSSKSLIEVKAFLKPGMSTDELYAFVKTTPALVETGRFHWMLKDGDLWTDFKPDAAGRLIISSAIAEKSP